MLKLNLAKFGCFGVEAFVARVVYRPTIMRKYVGIKVHALHLNWKKVQKEWGLIKCS